MTQVTVEYQNKDGVEGLALSNIKANSLFRRMGLRNGDVLVAVEGEPLTSTNQALQLYEKLQSADSASVEINRRGRSRIIQYNIR
jgi:general secretion pathway protein C